MSEIITFEEIKQRYDGQWVLIAYTEANDEFEVIEGKVIAHSAKKEDIYQALEMSTEQPLAIEYIGQLPEDIAFIL